MLSLVDLIEAGTVDLPLAGYLMAAVQNGTSFLVGALPGGAGKTTVMAALLNVLPPHVPIVPTDTTAVLESGLDQPAPPRRCYVCHEIGSGSYYAYLWGADARRLFRLPQTGHIVATNLHADTFDQCHAQLCNDNGVPDADFQQCGLMLFLAVVGSWSRVQRRVSAVHQSRDGQAHRLVYRWDVDRDRFEALDLLPTDPGTPAPEQCTAFLRDLLKRGQRTIRQVREALVEWDVAAT